jgi:hypothetical protein
MAGPSQSGEFFLNDWTVCHNLALSTLKNAIQNFY